MSYSGFYADKILYVRAERNKENNSKKENVIPAEMELMNGKNDAVMILKWDLSKRYQRMHDPISINEW